MNAKELREIRRKYKGVDDPAVHALLAHADDLRRQLTLAEADRWGSLREITSYIKKSVRPDVAPGYEYQVVLPDGSMRWAATLEAAVGVQEQGIRVALKAKADRAAREAKVARKSKKGR